MANADLQLAKTTKDEAYTLKVSNSGRIDIQAASYVGYLRYFYFFHLKKIS